MTLVAPPPEGAHIVISGMSHSAKFLPEKGDPSLEYPIDEIWTLAWDRARVGRADRAFEIHDPDMWNDYPGFIGNAYGYRKWLAEHACPIYMQKNYSDIPTSVPYPLDDVLSTDPKIYARLCALDRKPQPARDYFGSSIAYMLTLAWLWYASSVHIWGVELSNVNYDHQKPNLEYWIGRLDERGCEVALHGHGTLMKFTHPPGKRKFQRYGWVFEDE